jgi:hypothetical protein
MKTKEGYPRSIRSPGEGKDMGFFEEVIRNGEGVTDTLSLIRKDGMPFEADLSIKRIDLEDESFFQVIFKDLTEQRKLEKKIRESKEILRPSSMRYRTNSLYKLLIMRSSASIGPSLKKPAYLMTG